jgi:hypothetical protein
MYLCKKFTILCIFIASKLIFRVKIVKGLISQAYESLAGILARISDWCMPCWFSYLALPQALHKRKIHSVDGRFCGCYNVTFAEQKLAASPHGC